MCPIVIISAPTPGPCHDVSITDVNSNHHHHHPPHNQNEHRPQDRNSPSSSMSTLLCCEPVSAGRPRANLKLVLNRSLSEPGPNPCSFPTSPTVSPISSLVNNGNPIDTPDIINEETNGDSVGSDDDPHRRYHHLHYHHHHHHQHHYHHHHHLLSANTKRCKLETVSLPNSPCAENGTLHRQLVLSKTRVITSGDLAQRLAVERPAAAPVILDCRPFILYNVNHVRGAINVNCSDRFNRRRLQLGKATLADLATAREGKELLRKRQFREVVVYDDCTDDLEHLPAQHPLFLVLAALVDDDQEPALLIGELFDFFSF